MRRASSTRVAATCNDAEDNSAVLIIKRRVSSRPRSDRGGEWNCISRDLNTFILHSYGIAKESRGLKSHEYELYVKIEYSIDYVPVANVLSLMFYHCRNVT